MPKRKSAIQNRVIAKKMQGFFEDLPESHREDLTRVARDYGQWVWYEQMGMLGRIPLKLRSSPFHVGLSIDKTSLADLTKRVTLVSETLLLSHDRLETFHELGPTNRYKPRVTPELAAARISVPYREESFGMHCPDVRALGQWILDAAPLLKAGVAWYLPRYSLFMKHRDVSLLKLHSREDESLDSAPWVHEPIDFLIRDRRAIDASGNQPIKSSIVRPILQLDLPFIEGVSLRDFSNITVDEFQSYTAFRDYLRRSFLAMDTAIESDTPERELIKIGLEIAEHIRAVEAEMMRVRSKRVVAATGAGIGTVGAALVAVYGPALQEVLATIGATGGVWAVIQSFTDNTPRHLQSKDWYYVWALQRRARRL